MAATAVTNNEDSGDQKNLAIASYIPTGHYALMRVDMDDLREIIQANLGDAQLSPMDLDRIKVPAGGATTWQNVPSSEGARSEEYIEGVIVAHTSPRVFWRDAFGGGSKPPDCSSPDGKMGIGDPGVECARCEFADFGSAVRQDGKPGRGQACKQLRLLFMVRESGVLPVVVFAPPTSLKPIKDYLLHLTSEGVPFWGVVTRLELTSESNPDKIRYSIINPRRVGLVEPSERARYAAYRREIEPIVSRMNVGGAGVGDNISRETA